MEILKVIIIDDDEGDRMLLREYLKEAFGEWVEIEEANSMKAGLLVAGYFDADVILCDLNMPPMRGEETIMHFEALMHARPGSHPELIVLSGALDPELPRLAAIHGAKRFVRKQNLFPVFDASSSMFEPQGHQRALRSLADEINFLIQQRECCCHG